MNGFTHAFVGKVDRQEGGNRKLNKRNTYPLCQFSNKYLHSNKRKLFIMRVSYRPYLLKVDRIGYSKRVIPKNIFLLNKRHRFDHRELIA